MKNYNIGLTKFFVLSTLSSLLIACGGKDQNILRCLDNAAGLRPPSIEVNLVVDGVEGALCDARVNLVRSDAYHSEVPLLREAQTSGRTHCTYLKFLSFGANEFEVAVDLNGFEKAIVTNEQIQAIDPIPDECGVDRTVLTITPEPSALVCAEGYADFQGVCKTPAGCEYPSMQEAIAVDYVFSESSPYYSYQCTEECSNGLSESPGICLQALL